MTNKQQPLDILLIEDSETDALLNENELRNAGMDFASRRVETQCDVWAAIYERMPDVILADFRLVGFTALDILASLKEREFDIPFILITGMQTEEVAVECLKSGADDYILKSSLKRLPVAIRNAVEAHRIRVKQKEIEEKLTRNEQRYRSLVHNSSDITVIIEPDGMIRYVSCSVERIIGYATWQIEGTHMLDLIHPDDRASISESFQNTVQKEGTAPPTTFRLRRSDGSYAHLEAVGSNLLKDENVRGIVMNTRDVSERKRLEDRLIHSEKLTALGEMSAMIAHEFRNSLTSVKMILQLLGESKRLAKNDRQSLGVALDSIYNMESVVKELLHFARPLPMRFLPTSILDVVEESLALLKMQFDKEKIGIKVEVMTEIPKADMDSAQLREAFINILINAVQAIAAKSERQNDMITITIRLCDPAENLAQPDAESSGRTMPQKSCRFLADKGLPCIVIAFQDTGKGIEPEHLSRIFDPFFTTKSEGVGLGLAMVERTVHAHGGIIQAESNANGTIFRLYFPICKQSW